MGACKRATTKLRADVSANEARRQCASDSRQDVALLAKVLAKPLENGRQQQHEVLAVKVHVLVDVLDGARLNVAAHGGHCEPTSVGAVVRAAR